MNLAAPVVILASLAATAGADPSAKFQADLAYARKQTTTCPSPRATAACDPDRSALAGWYHCTVPKEDALDNLGTADFLRVTGTDIAFHEEMAKTGPNGTLTGDRIAVEWPIGLLSTSGCSHAKGVGTAVVKDKVRTLNIALTSQCHTGEVTQALVCTRTTRPWWHVAGG